MTRQMSRRSLLAASPLMLASCTSGDVYFGRAEPPRGQRLVFHIGAEPETLDPVMSQAGSEEFILPSLFEGLITLHPTSNEVLAGISTHYRVNPSYTSFTFYLRGHPKPSGLRLPGDCRLQHAGAVERWAGSYSA